MVSERRLLKRAVLKKWTPRQGSPRNLGLAVAQLSVPIGILIVFGSPYHSRPNGSLSEIRSTPDDLCEGELGNCASLEP